MVGAAFVGCGLMARHHIRNILAYSTDTHIPVVCEPSPAAYEAIVELFAEAGRDAPPNEPDLERMLANYGDQLEAVFIITPHVFHHDQTKACLEAGLDVLLEKPMVMNAAEARSLIETCERTGRLLVVAFQGGLSAEVRTAVSMLRAGELGTVLNINGAIWQNWTKNTDGAWRQQPALSGGGFLFDTGAHMLNTVVDLAGEEFDEVAAWLDNRGRPVEILAAVIGRLASGGLVTLSACGETIPSCSSDIRVYCTEGILRTGAWGRFLEIQRHERQGWEAVELPPSLGVWEQFMAVRRGDIPNPAPPEVGLRMAHLYDAIRASAARGGVPVPVISEQWAVDPSKTQDEQWAVDSEQ
jgi:predicted dehydrogenase